ncbi:MAG TPA: EamA family transporter [Limnochordales bacterium]
MAQESRAGQGGHWLVLLAAVLWGTTGTAQALAPAGAQPAAVGAVRLAIGGAALLILALGRGRLRLGDWRRPAAWVAAAGVAAYQVCFFAAVAATGVALGTLVGIGSAPISAGLLEWLVTGERPSRRWVLATALAVAGCALLLSDEGGWQVNSAGVLLALGAGASFAVYTVAGRRLLRAVSPDGYVAMAFAGGALLLAPVLFGSDLSWVAEPRGALVALHLGLIATALSYVLFGRGLARVPAATATTLSLAEPLTAALLGTLVLGERLGPVALFGAALIFIALGWLAWPSDQPRGASPSSPSAPAGKGFAAAR